MSVVTPEVRATIEQPLIGYLATTSADGFPHAVPLWYMLDGDDIVITSERRAAKVANLLRDNRAALVIGGKPGEGPAYLLRGRASISDDVGHAWLSKMTYHYEDAEEAAKDLAEWTQTPFVVIRLTIERVTKVF